MENRERLFRYLLGDLPPDEQIRMQKEAAANRALREGLREAESDLIDSYVGQRLPETQRNQFETYFLDSDDKRERVEMAQILLSPAVRRMAPFPESREFPREAPAAGIRMKPPGWNWLVYLRFGWAVATLVLAVTAVLVGVQNLRLRDELKRAAAARVNPPDQIQDLPANGRAYRDAPAEGAGSVAKKVNPRNQTDKISLLLFPRQQRSGEDANEPALLKLPPSPAIVLTLELEQDRYPQYDISIKSAEGREIWRKQSLKSQPGLRGAHVLVAHLPSDLLTPGDYFIKVSARASEGEQRTVDAYAFTVTR